MSDKPPYEDNNDFERYRLYIIGIAKDLRYSNKIQDRIRHAKSEIEISRIMISARQNQ